MWITVVATGIGGRRARPAQRASSPPRPGTSGAMLDTAVVPARLNAPRAENREDAAHERGSRRRSPAHRRSRRPHARRGRERRRRVRRGRVRRVGHREPAHRAGCRRVRARPTRGRAPGAARRLLRRDPGTRPPTCPTAARWRRSTSASAATAETTQVFRIGGASCAVPGATAGLEAVHSAYGRLPWAELLQPAIELARDGVELTRPQAHLHAILDLILRHTAEGRRLYSRADGSRLQPGDLLALPDLGETLAGDRRRRRRRDLPRRPGGVDRRDGRGGRRDPHRRRPRGVRGDLARAGARVATSATR